ncbi:MAG: cupin domain-containing protein [Saprospiraceae bacterium]
MNPIFTKRLKIIIEHFPTGILKIEEEDLRLPIALDKWSKKEILGHLIDSARVNLQRFLEVQHSPAPYIVQRYMQDELVKLNDYQNVPTLEIIQLWKSLNQQIVNVFDRVSESDLSKRVEIPHEDRIKDLRFIMEDYVAHLEHHVKQILGSLDFEIKNENRQVSVEEAMHLLGDDTRFATVLENGSMIVEIYQPIKKDLQNPHAQDELYVIISGSGEFLNDGKITEFKTGDVLFVPAGVEHRFEKFTEDFKTWVIFYGAIGGE